MGVFLVINNEICIFQHLLCQMIMRIEFQSDDTLAPQNDPGAGEQIPFAVVITIGDHRAMHGEEQNVRLMGFNIFQDLIAILFIDGLNSHASGLRGGTKAFNHLPVTCFRTSPPFMQRCGKQIGRLFRGGATEEGLFKGQTSCWDWRKGIGFRCNTGNQDFHGIYPSEREAGCFVSR